MTTPISRSFLLICLGLSLSGCAQYTPAKANCFTFRDTPQRAPASRSTVVSTMNQNGARHDTDCGFLMLGTDR